MMKIAKSVVIGVGKGGVAKTAWRPLCRRYGPRSTKCEFCSSTAMCRRQPRARWGSTPSTIWTVACLTDAVVYGDPLQVVAAPGRPGLDVVVAGRYTKKLAQALVSDPHGPAKFADAFTVIGERYDRIVIDLPPAGGASMIPTAALTVGEYLLVPTTDHVHDLEGLRVLGDDLLEANSAIMLLGVVLYKVGASHRRARYEARARRYDRYSAATRNHSIPSCAPLPTPTSGRCNTGCSCTNTSLSSGT